MHQTSTPKVGLFRKELKRFTQFLVVGLSGTLLDFAILTALKHFAGLPTLPANLISYSCGIINNFLLSRYWVYPEARQGQSVKQLIRFVLVSLVGLALNNLIVQGLEGPVGSLIHNATYAYIPAKLIATAVGLLWNYFANRIWTFGEV